MTDDECYIKLFLDEYRQNICMVDKDDAKLSMLAWQAEAEAEADKIITHYAAYPAILAAALAVIAILFSMQANKNVCDESICLYTVIAVLLVAILVALPSYMCYGTKKIKACRVKALARKARIEKELALILEHGVVSE